MAIFIASEGEQYLLNCAVGLTTPANLKMRLYVSAHTQSASDVASTYSGIQMATQGYVEKGLNMASWAVAAGEATGADLVWTFDGTGGSTTVYGYYVVEPVGGVLVWAEAFAAPITVTTTGDTLTIPRFISLISE